MLTLIARRNSICALLALAGCLAPVPAAAQKTETQTLTVFAAASLKNALDEISAAYAKAKGVKPVAVYAASSALAKQIEQGAPADIFISADHEWMDYLAGKKLIDEGSRRNLLGNALVLIAPASSTVKLDIAPGFALAKALGDGRLSVGEVKAAPAGRYAKAALESLGVWSSVEAKLAQAENVRAALAFVALGETPLGIVYRTDALAEPKVRVVSVFPASSHPPIVYPIVVTAGSGAQPAARAFVNWLSSADATAIFERRGFSVLK